MINDAAWPPNVRLLTHKHTHTNVHKPKPPKQLFLQEAGPEPVGHGNGNLGSYAVMLIDTAAAAFPVQRDVGVRARVFTSVCRVEVCVCVCSD